MKFETKFFLVLLGFVLFGVMVFKICGSLTELSTPISKQGYCKIQYGDDFKHDLKKDICYNKKDKEINYNFDLKSFEIDCKKPSFFSPHFYNKCFYANKQDILIGNN